MLKFKPKVFVWVIYDPKTNDLDMFLAPNNVNSANFRLMELNNYWGNTNYILVGRFE
jgi:hypothetical protein